MAMTKEQLETRMRSAQGIPANPEVQAKLAQEQPATPPGLEPATPEEQGLDPNAAAVDFFGSLAAEMDAETNSYVAPEARSVNIQRGKGPVEELPYEPPVHQRQPGEVESLRPREGEEPQQLEAAIEQPLVEEELRLTAEQWAAAQRSMQPPQQERPTPTPEIPNLEELEAKAIDQLLKTEYALEDEDKNLLISDPDQVIPKLAARMHVRMQTQIASQLAQVLPQMIQSQIQQSTKVQSLENQFFQQYPELNRPEHRSTVQESLLMIRNVNPEATREEVMRDGAALAAVRLKIRLGQTTPQLAPQQARPDNMPLSMTAPQPRQQPFTPAQSGGGSEPVVPTDPNAGNVFARLAMDPDW